MQPKWLFTDLDGTLIPLEGNRQNIVDLHAIHQRVAQGDLRLVFVTGRHLSSAVQAISQFDLPAPEWIICNVGTTIVDCSRPDQPLPDYQRKLADLTSGWNSNRLLEELDLPETIDLQEPEKQGDFKTSFYVPQPLLGSATQACERALQRAAAPYNLVSSIDPFTGDGLIDFLPNGVHKGFAIGWLSNRLNLNFESQVIYAGDSGNDTAALTSGCHAVLVGYASSHLAAQIGKRVAADKLLLATGHATSGVLQGLRHFAS